LTFWIWLFRGVENQNLIGSKSAKRPFLEPGFHNIINNKLAYHIIIGTITARLLSDFDLNKVASAVIIPLVAILIGILYTFGQTFQSLIQDKSIISLTKNHKNGLYEYSYNYQLSLLIFITTLSYWSILSIIDINNKLSSFYMLIYGTTSLSITLYTVWSFIAVVQELLIRKNEIAEKICSENSQVNQGAPPGRPPQRPAPPPGSRRGARGNIRPRRCRQLGRPLSRARPRP
jgi:hypothetical protein